MGTYFKLVGFGLLLMVVIIVVICGGAWIYAKITGNTGEKKPVYHNEVSKKEEETLDWGTQMEQQEEYASTLHYHPNQNQNYDENQSEKDDDYSGFSFDE